MWKLLLLLAVISVWLWQMPSLWIRVVVFIALNAYLLRKAYRDGLVPGLQQLWPKIGERGDSNIICFAGAMLDLPSWTNRQQVMSRMASQYPVLYVEPRVWLPRQLWRLRTDPKRLMAWLTRLVWYQEFGTQLVAIAQANLIPGSRRWRILGSLNQLMNAWWVRGRAKLLGFGGDGQVVWIYDTEAAAYLDDFPAAKVVYDCVDEHAVQAGLDRNPGLVRHEESLIMNRSDLVTVTSRRLYELKKDQAKRVELVLNAGDVELYAKEVGEVPEKLRSLSRPILGSVGALDEYKYDFDLLTQVAKNHPEWQLVFVGAPVVDSSSKALQALTALENVHVLGAVPREHVPAYVQAFDVCLIPYRNNEYNRASFPLKFWEFMATGKPIVVSGLPELLEYSDLIEYAEDQGGFEQAVEWALGNRRGVERVELARQHGFEQRVERLVELLEEVVQQKQL